MRIHDYERLYAVPGLYDEVVQHRLGCRTPDRMADMLAAAAALAALLALPGQAQQQATPAEGARPTAPDTAWFTSPSRFGQQDGQALYNAICAGCHMPDGRGAVGAGAFPALAGNTKLEAA